jgi:lipid-A-disaccharide synthase-like uncharacterized protein
VLERLYVAAGWLGAGAFFARFLVQWIASERAGRSRTPAAFWWLSLAGSAGLATYSAWRGEVVLLAGIAVNGAIYARNLYLARHAGARLIAGALRALLAAGAAALVLAGAAVEVGAADVGGTGWLACVLAGQAAWSSRFVVQWWHAEGGAPGALPPAFWWLSLLGNLLLLAYAVHLRDPVYVAGFLLGPVVQARNLWLGARASDGSDASAAGNPTPRPR